MDLRKDANQIIKESINKVLPYDNVRNTLKGKTFNNGKLIVVSIGKAAWSMAKACSDELQDKITSGIVITKYNHSKGNIKNFRIYEAGHPVPDNNTYSASKEVVKLVSNLTINDTVLFLLSGGGSALFEIPLIDEEELQDINNELLKSGANITEINTIRKRLSSVKGGKLAKLCKPAKVINLILSDVVGNKLDDIASGPTVNDTSTNDLALNIVSKYKLNVSNETKQLLNKETVKDLDNIESTIIGSVKDLCLTAKQECEKLGYKSTIVTDELTCDVKDAESLIIDYANKYKDTSESLAFIFGGETTVKVKGNGKGGRNQELSLLCVKELSKYKDIAFFSIGSDGTDGPTDGAGGLVDNKSLNKFKELNLDIDEYLNNDDSYNGLKKIDGLIITGPTGTNVNDLAVLLIKR